VAAGDEPLSYQWWFNETNVLAGATGATLELLGVQPADGGDYQVVVSNAVNVVTSAVATLTVVVPPSIVTHPTNVTALAWSDATFAVEAAGSEPLSYQWYFDEWNVLAGATGPTLVVSPVQVTNAGDYFVVVANWGGSATSQLALLTVDPGGNDTDGDGLLDWQEVMAGTDPYDSNSVLRVTVGVGVGGAQLEFVAMSNISYTVLYQTNVGAVPWLSLTNVAAQPGTNTVQITDPATGVPRYYRIVTPMQQP